MGEANKEETTIEVETNEEMVEKQTPEGEVLTEEESLEAQSDREESEEDQD